MCRMQTDYNRVNIGNGLEFIGKSNLFAQLGNRLQPLTTNSDRLQHIATNSTAHH